MAKLLFQDSGKTIHSAEENVTSYKRAGIFTEMKQKKIQNGRLKKFKMAASKKPHFPNLFFCFISVKNPALLYGVTFFSALWMEIPESWKRSFAIFYAHDCS